MPSTAFKNEGTAVVTDVGGNAEWVVEPLTDEQRRELIAVAAYYLAESRNFQPGHEHEDWLAAEVQVGSLGALVS